MEMTNKPAITYYTDTGDPVLTDNPKRAIIVTVPREKELKQLRAELLATLDQIERYLNISPRTTELRQRYKDSK